MRGPRRGTCPCCGGKWPAGRVPREELAGLFGSADTRHRLLRRLARRPGHWVLVDDLIEAVYGGQENGGPDNAEYCICASIDHAREDMVGSGWRIEKGRGPSIRCWRLVLA